MINAVTTDAPKAVGQTLTCTVDATDADGHTLITSYQWEHSGDDVVYSSVTGATSAALSIPSSLAHAFLRCRVGVDDGHGGADVDQSAGTQVLNTPPTPPGEVLVTPASNVTKDTPLLTCTAGGATDVDGDGLIYQFQWTVDDVEVAPWSEDGTLANSEFAAGQVVQCHARAYDGRDVGTSLASMPILVGGGSSLLACTWNGEPFGSLRKEQPGVALTELACQASEMGAVTYSISGCSEAFAISSTGVVTGVMPDQRCTAVVVASNGTQQESVEIGLEAYWPFHKMSGPVYSQALMPDGDMVVGGSFLAVDYDDAPAAVLLRPNGDSDQRFLGLTFANPWANSTVEAVYVYSDGRMLFGGDFDRYGEVPVTRLARVNPDGSLDTTFQANLGTGIDDVVLDIAVHEASGRIYLAGQFDTVDGHTSAGLAVLDGDGTVRTGFRVGSGYIDGTGATFPLVDHPTGFEPVVVAVDQATEDVYAGGSFTAVGTRAAHNRLARFNPANGYVDERFVTGAGTGVDRPVYAILVVGTGEQTRIYLGGDFRRFNNVTVGAVVRLLADGSREGGYPNAAANAPNGGVTCLALSPQGHLYVGGWYDAAGPGSQYHGLMRLNPDGTADSSFPNLGDSLYDVRALAVDPRDNAVVIAGKIPGGIQRRMPDGSVDASFDVGPGLAAEASWDELGRAVSVGSAGQVVVGGEFIAYRGVEARFLMKFNPQTMALDTGFMKNTYANETVNALTVDEVNHASPMLYVGGFFNGWAGVHGRYGLVRVDAATGEYDSSFTPPVQDLNVIALHLFSGTGDANLDGDIMAVGYADLITLNGTQVSGVARFNPDGTVDTAFNQGTDPDVGFLDGDVRAVVHDPTTGDLFIGGSFTSYRGVASRGLIRLNLDGTVDSGWSPGTYSDWDIRDILFASDGTGELLLVGSFDEYRGEEEHGLVRVSALGERVVGLPRFTSHTFDIHDGVIQDGVLYAAGLEFWDTSPVSSNPRNGVIALDLATGALLPAYDGPGGISVAPECRAWSVLPVTHATGSWLFLGGEFNAYSNDGTVQHPVRNLVRLEAASGHLAFPNPP